MEIELDSTRSYSACSCYQKGACADHQGLPVLACTLTFILITHSALNDWLFIMHNSLLVYAKNGKICSMERISLDMTFSLMFILCSSSREAFFSKIDVKPLGLVSVTYV